MFRRRTERISGPIKTTIVFAAVTMFVCLAGLLTYAWFHRA